MSGRRPRVPAPSTWKSGTHDTRHLIFFASSHGMRRKFLLSGPDHGPIARPLRRNEVEPRRARAPDRAEAGMRHTPHGGAPSSCNHYRCRQAQIAERDAVRASAVVLSILFGRQS
jgi:hypothetical protein